MISDIWKRRKKEFLKLLLKSVKYIFNDSLVSMILFVLLFMYSDLKDFILELKTIDKDFFLLLIGLTYSLLVLKKKYFIFIKKPDLIFLGTKQKDITTEIKKAIREQILLSFILELPIYFATFLVLSLTIAEYKLLVFLHLIVLLKAFQCIKIKLTLSEAHNSRFSDYFFNFLLMLVFSSVVFHLFFLSYLLFGLSFYLLRSRFASKSLEWFNWSKLIDYESKSWNRLSAVLGNFIEVERSASENSKSFLAEKLINLIPRNKDCLLIFIFSRVFFRKSENRMNLYVVAIVISMVAIATANSLISVFMLLFVHTLYATSVFEQAIQYDYAIEETKQQYKLLAVGLWLTVLLFFLPAYVISLIFEGAILMLSLILSFAIYAVLSYRKMSKAFLRDSRIYNRYNK